ncbi:MAG: FkbM family methyltransferase [Pseudomonadota bacterium]
MSAIRKLVVDSVKRMADSAGVAVVPHWRMRDLPLANYLRQILLQYDIEIVIDVGANQGQYHDLLRDEVGFKGQILSFEPVQKYVAMLSEKAREDKAWRIYDFALGASSGSAKINVATSAGLDSFLSPRIDAVPHFWKDNPISHEETAQIRTLDDVLQQAGIDCGKQGVYLKLDTQGFDLEVLKGAPIALEQIKALQTEASVRPIYYGMPTYLETLSCLNERGFDLSAMFPISYDDMLRVIELDCIFINAKKLTPAPVDRSRQGRRLPTGL